MNIALWVIQALLAFAFFAAGAMKLGSSMDDLATNGMNFVTYTPEMVVRFIGLSEVLGALGLILPSALRIQPKLTPIAAALLAVVMLLALGTHAAHGEMEAFAPNVVLGALCAFVAWGRLSKAPIAAK